MIRGVRGKGGKGLTCISLKDEICLIAYTLYYPLLRTKESNTPAITGT
jgi:hypothetical protein